MERAEVLFGQPLPALSSGGRPKVARHTAGQTFAVIVDLGQRLLALIAACDLVRVSSCLGFLEAGDTRDGGLGGEVKEEVGRYLSVTFRC